FKAWSVLDDALRVPVIGVIPLAENMPDGAAQRPGDVVHMLGGTSVEIINTDAEGRMLLADGITLVKQLGATHVLDIATLTYASVVALGRGYAALMDNHADWRERIYEAASLAGERLWSLPIDHESLARSIQSDVADVRHAADDVGGMLTAGHFLSRFATGVPWAHIDMALLGWDPIATAFSPAGPKGGLVETLFRLAYVMAQRGSEIMAH
ncbi:MAG: M17 family metallopeptidase, partial [Sulfobacillus sp.]